MELLQDVRQTSAATTGARTGTVVRRAQASGGVRTVPLFVGSYLAIWALVGVAVYALYRPRTLAAAHLSLHVRA
jgi:hypothetical protein